MLRIKLVKSPIGNNVRNRATVQALGLKKMHHSVYLPDNPSVRGMIHHVKHMLEVTEISDKDVPTNLPHRRVQPKAGSGPMAAAGYVSKPAEERAPAKAKAPKPEKAAAPKKESPKAEAKPSAEKKKTTAKPKKPNEKKSEEKN